MHRQLPKDLNLHTLSFLSSKEITQSRLVNKECNTIANASFLWKLQLKNDFNFTDLKNIKNPLEKFKELSKQIKLEDKLILSLIEPYFFSLQIQQNFIKGLITDPPEVFYTSLLTKEEKIVNARHDHLVRINQLDLAILKSAVNEEYISLQKRYPNISPQESKQYALAFFLDNNDLQFKSFWNSVALEDKKLFNALLLLAIAKINIPIYTRIFVTRDRLSNELLEDLLFTACGFLNIETVKILLEQDVKVNFFREPIEIHEQYSKTTPLFEVLNAIRRLRIYNPKQTIAHAEALIHLLLENGADPDARIYIANGDIEVEPEFGTEVFENNKQSIRELCVQRKLNPGSNPIEILDLIIEASDQKNTHKCKR